MKPVWATRTGAEMAGPFAAYSETTGEDLPYLVHDLAGSIAHVMGLHHIGLLDAPTARSLIAGLQDLHQSFEDGSFVLDPQLEDVHMNIEAALTTRLGETAKRLHTGRSRNDQVATCITLRSRAGLLALADACGDLSGALVSQAAAHANTPWVAKTHGRPAQPATLGYLLVAHGIRLQTVQNAALRAFEDLARSPLGCGAVAGSSLPLQPAYTANLLGLEPPQNGLLSTGTRDTAITAIQVCGNAGFVFASLAQDLMDLFEEGAITLPSGTTTGSSLMPHKRNPDALELSRGVGKALASQPATAMALVTGLGLGYQRDMQAMKPLLDTALDQAIQTGQVLHQVVLGLTVNTSILAATLSQPGITATDAVEAVVKLGVPFRVAYEGMARANKAREAGQDMASAINALDWTQAHKAAAIAALTADASARNTLAGPSPTQVAAQVTGAQATAGQLAQKMANAAQLVAIPTQLLSADPQELVP